ncbi:Uncharacterised protein [Mycobacteroides abscessus subsp. abscessus]|nr:Uncharacterised protein [Mycobacteroides abscessus subsp. abscessus]
MIGGSRCSEPISATIATLASRTLNFASELAYRISAAAMRSTPPPMHQP